jgi:hypothetical protein
LDDASALATAFCEYEAVQGLTIQASVVVPIDKRSWQSTAEPSATPTAEPGEWGPTVLGFNYMAGLTAKVRF